MSNPTEAISGLRRLPWKTESGKPAYLSADDPNSLLAVMADTVEAQMLASAEEVLRFARDLLAGGTPLTADEIAYTAQRLTECLADAVRVATLRGERLPEPVDAP
ncbi:hypothetical protein [Streptomyces lycii]|uniref:Uncharacterized protein n=1 Tax=Streptomyces lycii TaxID=2654337 RepID=A0ABQ7FRM7_9ACTN|nr:hypothetical protein [Streptomyces lycii]KAF4410908.1 hypothetical protein GCU69_01425 [Streptomyces lycii]